MADHIVLPRCTVQTPRGDFCDAPSAEDVPYPICIEHATVLALHTLETIRQHHAAARPVEELAHAHRQEHEERLRIAQQVKAERSQVYYLRMPTGRIKIGYTANIRQRCSTLRVRTSHLLATEPGGRDIERLRHQQFADLRVGRLEEFEAADELLAHIEATRRRHGEPTITGWIGPASPEVSERITTRPA